MSHILLHDNKTIISTSKQYHLFRGGELIGSYRLFADAWLMAYLCFNCFGLIVDGNGETVVVNPYSMN